MIKVTLGTTGITTNKNAFGALPIQRISDEKAVYLLRKAYENGIFDKLLTTNLVYRSPELLEKPYYITCDMSKYIALIIDTLNHDNSISRLLNPVDRIKKCVNNYMSRYDK